MYPHKGRDFLGALVIPGMGEAGALIAAPDCPSESWTAPESEALVLAFVERMRQQGSIDPRRVALMGYSMGGIGAWHIASRNQERFSAAVILSARPLEAALRASWRIPLYLIHSRQDEVFPFSEVQSAVEKLRDAGAEVYFDLLDGLTHFQTHRFVKPLRRAADWLAARWGAATQSAPGEG
jgi:predicted esterase